MHQEWKGSEVHDWVQELAARFGQEVQTGYHKCSVTVPPPFGEGTISGYVFAMGLRLLLLSFNLKESLKGLQPSGNTHPLQLHFSFSGHFSHHMNGGEEKYSLEQLSSSIAANPRLSANLMCFSEKRDIRHILILIDRAEYQSRLAPGSEGMEEGLKELLGDTGAEGHFLFKNYFNLAVSESINALFENTRQGYTNSAFVEGKALQLIALQFEQYKKGWGENAYKLKEENLQVIREAHKILLNNLEASPTIKQLAREVGVNQQTLKKGFKELYGLPVNQYLRNLRMEKARALLLESNDNIKEVAHQVGYSNSSYFSRRFRERYGMLPKDARK